MSDFQHEAGRFAAFIDRADREEMEAVQGDLLRIALERPDPAGRVQAMDSLQRAGLRTLYVTSAGLERPAAERARYPLSGCVLSLRVDVAGLAEPLYQP